MQSFSPWLADHLEVLKLWFGAIGTLGLFSILYRENKVYRFFEHLFLGVSMGYLIVNAYTDTILPKFWEPFYAGQWWLIFTIIIGLFYYFIFSQKFAWLARLMIAFFLGVTSGRAFKAYVNDYWPQIPTSFKPLVPHGAFTATDGTKFAELTWGGAINNLIFMIILVCVMSYFFFSFEQKSPILKNSAKWGRWLLMFAFGAIFGSTIMGRLALLIDRITFLMKDFGGGAIHPTAGPWIMFVFLAIMTGLVLYLTRKNAQTEVQEGAS